MNRTHGGYEVSAAYTLRFSFPRYYAHDPDGPLFELSLEWNTEGNKRRPYFVLDIAGFHFQGGWLWDQRGSQ